jgi:hypothetical protein
LNRRRAKQDLQTGLAEWPPGNTDICSAAHPPASHKTGNCVLPYRSLVGRSAFVPGLLA